MSLTVSGSNTSNPFAALQSLWQQLSSTSGTQTQFDPLSGLFGQQGSGASGSTSSVTAAGSTEPQFGSQTLQALLALQANGSSSQSLTSQFDNATSASDPLSAMQSGQSEGQHRHHHHHMGTNGSTTTDAASSGSSASDTSSTTAAGGNGTGNNFIEQLFQTQAQLVTPVSAQSITTA